MHRLTPLKTVYSAVSDLGELSFTVLYNSFDHFNNLALEMKFWKTWCLLTRGIIQAAFADITALGPSVSPVAGEKERRPRRKWRTERVIVLSVRQNMYPDSPRGYISSRSTIKALCIIQESCYPLYTHCKSPQSSDMSSLACLPGGCWFTRRNWRYTLTLSFFINRREEEHCY